MRELGIAIIVMIRGERRTLTGPVVAQAVLAAPLGVNKLLDMLEDGREVIRNEAILLLLGLTRTSPDLQKIAAFQGAFPRLLHIVR